MFAGKVVLDDGTTHPVGSKSQRRALQMLARAGGGTVTYPQLIRGCWGRKGSSGKNEDNVHHIIAGLRKIPGLGDSAAGPIKTHPGDGYSLHLGATKCDIAEVERSVARVETLISAGKVREAARLVAVWNLDVTSGEFLAQDAGVVRLVRRGLVAEAKIALALRDAEAAEGVLERASALPQSIRDEVAAVVEADGAMTAIGGGFAGGGRRARPPTLEDLHQKALNSARLGSDNQRAYYDCSDPHGYHTLRIARLQIDEALRLDPDCLLALRTLVRLQFDDGEHDAMVATAIGGVLAHPTTRRAWVALAEALTDVGLSDEALRILARVVR